MNRQPYNVVDTSSGAEGWQQLRQRFADGRPNASLDGVLSLARKHGVRSVLVERYIDADYRDEYSHFYSKVFRPSMPNCHRLHFFTEQISPTTHDLRMLQPAYRGYSVMRPIPTHPVGRTLMTPPPALQSTRSVVCAVEEQVHPYGYPLTVTGMPFTSSGGGYLSSGHAAQWMVLYHNYLAYGLPRRLPGEIYDASLGGEVIGRQLPSAGLSHPQILNSLHKLQMPAGVVRLPESRTASRAAGTMSLHATLRRFINSQLPPIVANDWQTWVVAGYSDDGTDREHYETQLYVHDDIRGPYISVEDPWEERERGSWDVIIPALPESLIFDAESAEVTGTLALQTAARDPDTAAAAFLDVVRAKALGIQTYAIRANEYKARLEDRVPKGYRVGNPPDSDA